MYIKFIKIIEKLQRDTATNAIKLPWKNTSPAEFRQLIWINWCKKYSVKMIDVWIFLLAR